MLNPSMAVIIEKKKHPSASELIQWHYSKMAYVISINLKTITAGGKIDLAQGTVLLNMLTDGS